MPLAANMGVGLVNWLGVSSRLESSVDAGDAGCTGGGISSSHIQPHRQGGARQNPSPCMAMRGPRCGLCSDYGGAHHCPLCSSFLCDSCSCLYGRPQPWESQIPRTTQHTELEGAVTVPSRARCSHSGVSYLHHPLQSVWELSVSYLIAFLS